jgi:hypothetical protein
MSLDSTDRILLIKEAVFNLIENPQSFGQRRYQTENPPRFAQEWESENNNMSDTSHRLNWEKPRKEEDSPGFVGPPDPQGVEKYRQNMRTYNLWNQRGLDSFDPGAKTQSYAPSWNVRGDERRQQTRAYLNYIRSDPERLARFRAQSNNNTIGKVASFGGRPESEVQSRLAAYNQGARASRISAIHSHSPDTASSLSSVKN